MIKKLFFQIAPVILLSTPSCFAQEVYLFPKLGYTILKKMELTDKDPNNGVVEGELSYNNGMAINTELGIAIDNLRVGIDVGIGTNSLESGTIIISNNDLQEDEEVKQKYNLSGANEDIINANVLINVAKDFPLGNKFTPYVGCGLGYIIISEGYTDTTDGYSAYQFEMGGKFRLTKKFELGLGYRWFFTGQNPMLSLTINNKTHNLRTEYSQHILFAGLVMNLLEE